MLNRSRNTLLAITLMTGLGLSGCAIDSSNTDNTKSAGGKLSIVATTGYLGDAIANIAPDVDLTVLVKPGGDPHTQALTTKDSEKIQSANLVVWTSHDMEHQMMASLDKLGDRQLAAAESEDIKPLLLPWEEDGKIEGNDPHVWNSPEIWMKVVNNISEKLAKIDPDNANHYRKNAASYNEKISAASKEAASQFDKIPEERRVLITGHDAFNYLGKAFNLEIHATDFVSSEAEMSPTQLDDLATLIASKKVPVIFQDNLKNPQAILNLKKAVSSKGWNVSISDKELFADSLGTEAPTDTYIGAFKHNVKAISEALSK